MPKTLEGSSHPKGTHRIGSVLGHDREGLILPAEPLNELLKG